jgi:hypothetical protein
VVAGDRADVVGRVPTGRDILHACDRYSNVVGLVKEERIGDLVEEPGRGQTRQQASQQGPVRRIEAEGAVEMIEVLPASMV